MLESYKDIMNYYGQSEVASVDTIADYSTDDVICITKTLGNEQLFILVNMRNGPVEPPVPAGLISFFWRDALTNDTLQFGASVQLYN